MKGERGRDKIGKGSGRKRKGGMEKGRGKKFKMFWSGTGWVKLFHN